MSRDPVLAQFIKMVESKAFCYLAEDIDAAIIEVCPEVAEPDSRCHLIQLREHARIRLAAELLPKLDVTRTNSLVELLQADAPPSDFAQFWRDVPGEPETLRRTLRAFQQEVAEILDRGNQPAGKTGGVHSEPSRRRIRFSVVGLLLAPLGGMVGVLLSLMVPDESAEVKRLPTESEKDLQRVGRLLRTMSDPVKSVFQFGLDPVAQITGLVEGVGMGIGAICLLWLSPLSKLHILGAVAGFCLSSVVFTRLVLRR